MKNNLKQFYLWVIFLSFAPGWRQGVGSAERLLVGTSRWHQSVALEVSGSQAAEGAKPLAQRSVRGRFNVRESVKGEGNDESFGAEEVCDLCVIFHVFKNGSGRRTN